MVRGVYVLGMLLTIYMQGCGLISDYGDRLTFGAGEVYYKDGVTEKEAEKLGSYLTYQGIFDEETPNSIQIIKKNDTYIFRMITKEEFIHDKELGRTMEFMSMDLSADVFDNAKVDIQLTNTTFETKREIPFFGVRSNQDSATIYRSLDVDVAMA